jgi:hypothetical protein
METFNIISLIEKNSITVLNRHYENQLVNKLQKTFSTKEQQIFLTSFFAYLNYNSKKDFVIDFDNVWKWVGFTRKDHAKRLLEKYFTKDIDYILYSNENKTISPRSEEKKETRGRKENIIMLTTNTFKKFCLKANTKKADEIHDYYIKLEELLHETIMEQTNELQLQLEKKEKMTEDLEFKLLQEQTDLIKAKKSLLKVQTKFTHRHKLDDKPCVYILENPDDKYTKYKIGMTTNINERLKSDRTMIPYIKARLIMYTEHYEIFEKIIKIKFAEVFESPSHEWVFYNLNKLIDGYNEINRVCGFNGVLEEELWKINLEEPTQINNKELKPKQVKYLPEALQPEKDDKPSLLPTRLLRYDYDKKNKEAPVNMRFCNGFCQDYKHLNDFNKQSAYYLQKCKNCISLELLAYEKIDNGELTYEQVIKDINCVILKEDEKMCKNCKNIYNKDRFEGNRNVCKTCRNKQCAHRLNEFDKNVEEEVEIISNIQDYEELVSYLDKFTKRPLQKILQHLNIGRKYNDSKQDVKNKILNYYFYHDN